MLMPLESLGGRNAQACELSGSNCSWCFSCCLLTEIGESEEEK